MQRRLRDPAIARAGASVETASRPNCPRGAEAWRSCAVGKNRALASLPQSRSGSSSCPDVPCSSSCCTRSPYWCWTWSPPTAGCGTAPTGATLPGASAPRTWLTSGSYPAAAAGGSGESFPRVMASTVASRVLTDGTGLSHHFDNTFACTLSFTCKDLWPDFQTKGNLLSPAIALYVSEHRDLGKHIHTHQNPSAWTKSLSRFCPQGAV